MKLFRGAATAFEWAVVAALCALVLLLGPTALQGAQPDPRQVVAELLLELHYDGPPPEITWVDRQGLVEVCGCAPRALYRDNTAYLSHALDLSDVFDRSVLLHELVHHVQWIAGGPAGADCAEWRRREEIAHAVQNAWLAEHGSARRVFFTGGCR